MMFWCSNPFVFAGCLVAAIYCCTYCNSPEHLEIDTLRLGNSWTTEKQCEMDLGCLRHVSVLICYVPFSSSYLLLYLSWSKYSYRYFTYIAAILSLLDALRELIN